MIEPRILHVSSARTWRGGEQQIRYLLDWQGDNHIKTVLLCPENSALSSTPFNKNVKLYSFPKRSSIDFAFARQIVKIVKSERINLVHLHDSHSHTAGIIACLFFGLKAPLVLHRRVAIKAGKGFFSKFKYRHKSIKKIICVSHKVREILLPVLNNPAKATVIYDGVDPGKWEKTASHRKQLTDKYNIPADKFIIAHIGALEPEKGFFTFLDTALKINEKKENCFFLIVGQGSMLETLKKYARDNSLTNLVFTGFVKDITEILPHIDLLLFTPDMEGLGSTVLDAMFSGIPIVSTSAGGIPELIQDKKQGLLADPTDSEKLASNSMAIMENKDFSQKMIESAFEKAQMFTIDKIAQNIYNLYLNIL